MIGASSAEIALNSVLEDPDLDARLRRVRKTLTGIESSEMKATHRVCQTLRRVILSVKEDVGATPSQKELAAEFYQRVRKHDPRRVKVDEEKQRTEEREAAEAAPIDSPEHQELLASTYVPGEWFMHRAPANDNAEFERLLDAERHRRESCPEEFLVFRDKMVRDLVTTCGKYDFTPDGLEHYAHGIRGPYTFEGAFTEGGKGRADVLLCRERLIAGTCAPPDRKPNLSKLKAFVSPLFWELFVERL